MVQLKMYSSVIIPITIVKSRRITEQSGVQNLVII
jgi:hypothetical protein